MIVSYGEEEENHYVKSCKIVVKIRIDFGVYTIQKRIVYYDWHTKKQVIDLFNI